MQDLFFVLLGVAVVVLPIYLIIKVIKNKVNRKKEINNSSFDKIEKDNNSIEERRKIKLRDLKLTDIKHIEGISSLREEEDCSLKVNEEELSVISKIGNFNISLDRIVNAGILTKKEMESKNKSVLGRAIVGSMVGLGFIGALSGIGQKVKKKYNYFLIINYKDKNSEEIKLLVFGLGKYSSVGKLFVDRLTKRLSNEKVNIDL